ncbi:hypothetical protein OIE75_33180 [Streptomyces sp. NBC_01723]|nr:hypothetical protein [Streptomyces sp. NBC_01723]
MAHLVTGTAESFVCTDLINGQEQDAAKTEAAVTALPLGASWPEDP